MPGEVGGKASRDRADRPGWLLLDDRSSRRHAAACASRSSLGCDRNGSATRSTFVTALSQYRR
jgi:hypothetical protein